MNGLMTLMHTTSELLRHLVGVTPRSKVVRMSLGRIAGVTPTEHREHCPPLIPPAMVCRPVYNKEMLESQAANRAIQQEWDRIRARRPWDEDHPRERADVARDSGEEVHVGMMWGSLWRRIPICPLETHDGNSRAGLLSRATKIGKRGLFRPWQL